MTLSYRRVSPEVLYTEAPITTASRSEVEDFERLAQENPRKRMRLCTHASPSDTLHEMLIYHERGAYVRPHRHPAKIESTHVIEGEVDVVVFDDAGEVTQVLRMGDYASGRTFYYRMAVPVFHTLIIRSAMLVFHETTNGPFDRKATVFADWAPADDDVRGIEAFIAGVEQKIRFMQ